MKLKFIILIIIIAVSISAINDNAGTTGFAFLKINFSARAVAMGNAYSGLADDADAMFYNPAGLVQIKKIQVSTTYMSFFEEIQCGSVALAIPRDEKATYGFFLKGLSAESERTLEDSEGYFGGYSGTYGMSDFVVGLSFSRYVLENLDLGLSAKYVRETLDDRSASAFAFDFALMHQTTQENLKLGIALRNFGKQISYHTDNQYEENLPRTFAVGFKFQPKPELIITLDVNKPFENDIYGSLGLEYQLHRMLKLRTGYKSNAADWKTGGDAEIFSGISGGLGFNIRSIGFDYAVASYGDLGMLHQLSLNHKF